MAHRRERVGTGLTERDQDLWSGTREQPLTGEDWAQIHARVSKHPIEPIEDACLKVLSDAGIPHPTPNWSPTFEPEDRGFAKDSPEDFAVRMLQLIRHIRFCEAQGDQAAALEAAMGLANLWTSWRIKLEHEPAWRTGRLMRESLASRRNAANEQRQQVAADRHDKWQQAASEKWERLPNLSKTAVATQIKKDLKEDAKVDTIRRAIRKS